MCGIIGCVRRGGDVKETLLSGLRRMEYRGYDSAGIAVYTEGRIVVHKKLGRLDNLERALAAERGFPQSTESTVGIGHTRWATHGAPSDRNAHPHRGCDDKLVVIHNGILENYLQLKEELQAKGHRFSSETDSEVFAHLLEDLLPQERDAAMTKPSALARATARAVQKAQGSFGLVILHQGFPECIVVARRDSPIVIGLAADAGYVGSDVPAFLPYTNRALFLHDEEIAEVFAGRASIFEARTLREVEREEATIRWTAEQAEKQGYPHFMLKEIFEQPEVLARTAFGRLREAGGDVAFEDSPLRDEDLRKVEKVHLLACGTALHACLVGKFWLEGLARLPVEVDFASEYRYRNPLADERVLAVAVSQSGETADTIGAVREARRLGAQTLAVCNVIGSSLSREVGTTVLTHAGPEIGVASTKAFVAQLVALYLLAIRFGRARGRLGQEQGRKRIRELRMLRAHLERLLQEDWVRIVEEAARDCHRAAGFFFLGRGINYPIALEGALKLKEISYIHAEGYPAGEMKHGPIALVEPGYPVIAIAPPGAVYEKIRSNMQEIAARGGKLIVVGRLKDASLRREAAHLLPIPEVPEDLSPLATVVPLQLFAYHVARLRGCDIDKPRNLAKSVTVE